MKSMMGHGAGLGLLLAFLVSVAAAQPSSDVILVSNCLLEDAGDYFDLTDSEMKAALGAVDPQESFSSADLDTFRRYNTYQFGCVADEAKVRVDLARYITAETLATIGKYVGDDVDRKHLAREWTADACDRLEAALDEEDNLVLEGLIDALDEQIEVHPFLGNPLVAFSRDEEIAWRAYYVGRARFEAGGQAAVDGYAHAFRGMRTSKNSVPTDWRSVPLFYLMHQDLFPQENIKLFGTVNAQGNEPLDFSSYLVRRLVWKYIMTGVDIEGLKPAELLQSASLVGLGNLPDLDLSPYLNGKAPAPEGCRLLDDESGSNSPEGEVYEAVRQGVVELAKAMKAHQNERMKEAHGARQWHQGVQSFRALVTPHLFRAGDLGRCASHVVNAQWVADVYDEHGAFIKSTYTTGTISELDRKFYDSTASSREWSPSLMVAVNSGQPLSDAQKEAVLSERTMTGTLREYYGGVRLDLVNTCKREDEVVEILGVEVTLNSHPVVRSKVVAGRWRED